MNVDHDQDGAKRREMITDMVRRWQKKNLDEMQVFGKRLALMRQQQPHENQTHAYSLSLPNELMQQIEFITGTDDETRFLNSKKELAWFKSTFPEFVIPYAKES